MATLTVKNININSFYEEAVSDRESFTINRGVRNNDIVRVIKHRIGKAIFLYAYKLGMIGMVIEEKLYLFEKLCDGTELPENIQYFDKKEVFDAMLKDAFEAYYAQLPDNLPLKNEDIGKLRSKAMRRFLDTGGVSCVPEFSELVSEHEIVDYMAGFTDLPEIIRLNLEPYANEWAYEKTLARAMAEIMDNHEYVEPWEKELGFAFRKVLSTYHCWCTATFNNHGKLLTSELNVKEIKTVFCNRSDISGWNAFDRSRDIDDNKEVFRGYYKQNHRMPFKDIVKIVFNGEVLYERK